MKKSIKKLFALGLALAMVAGSSLTTLAANNENEKPAEKPAIKEVRVFGYVEGVGYSYLPENKETTNCVSVDVLVSEADDVDYVYYGEEKYSTEIFKKVELGNGDAVYRHVFNEERKYDGKIVVAGKEQGTYVYEDLSFTINAPEIKGVRVSSFDKDNGTFNELPEGKPTLKSACVEVLVNAAPERIDYVYFVPEKGTQSQSFEGSNVNNGDSVYRYFFEEAGKYEGKVVLVSKDGSVDEEAVKFTIGEQPEMKDIRVSAYDSKTGKMEELSEENRTTAKSVSVEVLVSSSEYVDYVYFAGKEYQSPVFEKFDAGNGDSVYRYIFDDVQKYDGEVTVMCNDRETYRTKDLSFEIVNPEIKEVNVFGYNEETDEYTELSENNTTKDSVVVEVLVSEPDVVDYVYFGNYDYSSPAFTARKLDDGTAVYRYVFNEAGTYDGEIQMVYREHTENIGYDAKPVSFTIEK